LSSRQKNSSKSKLLWRETTLAGKKISVEKPNGKSNVHHKRRNNALLPDGAHRPKPGLKKGEFVVIKGGVGKPRAKKLQFAQIRIKVFIHGECFVAGKFCFFAKPRLLSAMDCL
jgi:hypothetical protein